ncbi:MAG: prolyl-tRNA synthetase [Candidatus Saccharibacteria bacterium]|nr:prolyl-tRNA synthetase [Candidatus Saccharibacteria bacterium]
MQLGTLSFDLIDHDTVLVAPATAASLQNINSSQVYVTEIDPTLSDTAAFCDHYGIGMDISANCVILEAKRGDRTWYAACMILATDRADVNNIIRRQLDARKISFAPMDTATCLTGMEFGGITPIGLPADWPILVDRKVAEAEHVIIGGGIRKSKLLVPGGLLAELPNATVLNLAKET